MNKKSIQKKYLFLGPLLVGLVFLSLNSIYKPNFEMKHTTLREKLQNMRANIEEMKSDIQDVQHIDKLKEMEKYSAKYPDLENPVEYAPQVDVIPENSRVEIKKQSPIVQEKLSKSESDIKYEWGRACRIMQILSVEDLAHYALLLTRFSDIVIAEKDADNLPGVNRNVAKETHAEMQKEWKRIDPSDLRFDDKVCQVYDRIKAMPFVFGYLCDENMKKQADKILLKNQIEHMNKVREDFGKVLRNIVEKHYNKHSVFYKGLEKTYLSRHELYLAVRKSITKLAVTGDWEALNLFDHKKIDRFAHYAAWTPDKDAENKEFIKAAAEFAQSTINSLFKLFGKKTISFNKWSKLKVGGVVAAAAIGLGLLAEHKTGFFSKIKNDLAPQMWSYLAPSRG